MKKSSEKVCQRKQILAQWNGGKLAGAMARLAKETGLSKMALSKIFSGQSDPRPATLIRFSTVFGLPEEELQDAFISPPPAHTMAARIAYALAVRGLTSAACARLLGVSHTAVRQWRAGISVPKPDHLKNLAQLTGQDMQYFLKEPEQTIFSQIKKQNVNASAKPRSVGVGRGGGFYFTSSPEEALMREKVWTLEIEDNSFAPVFARGDQAVFDTGARPYVGAYVMVEMSAKKYTLGVVKIAGKKTVTHTILGIPLRGKIVAVLIARNTPFNSPMK